MTSAAPRAVSVQQPDAAISNLRGLLQLPTVSHADLPDHVTDPEAFQQALAYLEATYSDLLNAPGMKHEVVSQYSMLLEWRGTDPSLQPMMMYGHYDVVPVGNGTEAWKFDPFSAQLHDGYATVHAVLTGCVNPENRISHWCVAESSCARLMHDSRCACMQCRSP